MCTAPCGQTVNCNRVLRICELRSAQKKSQNQPKILETQPNDAFPDNHFRLERVLWLWGGGSFYFVGIFCKSVCFCCWFGTFCWFSFLKDLFCVNMWFPTVPRTKRLKEEKLQFFICDEINGKVRASFSHIWSFPVWAEPELAHEQMLRNFKDSFSQIMLSQWLFYIFLWKILS